jgi:putative phage-type endonuclease
MNSPFDILCPWPLCTITPLIHGSPAWLEARRTGVTASDLPILMGHGTITPLELYNKKLSGDEIESTRQMQFGLHLESLICEWATEDLMADKLKLVNWHCVRKEHKNFQATVDAVATIGSEAVPVEIKTAVYSDKDQWLDDSMPKHYYLQVQWQLYITGADRAYLVCLPGGNASRLIIREVLPETSLQYEMSLVAIEFVRALREKTPPPALAEDLSSLPAPLPEADYNPDNEFMDLYEAYSSLNKKIKSATEGVSDLEKKAKDIKAQMAQRMGQASLAVFPYGSKTATITRKVIEVKEKVIPASSYQRLDVREK